MGNPESLYIYSGEDWLKLGDFKDGTLIPAYAEQLKGKTMEFNEYVRKPFIVEAVEVTEENIAEVAKYVGELREKDDGTPFIYVDRRLVPNIFRVYPGFFMTRMGDHIRCYSRKVFNEQFSESSPEIVVWVDFMQHGGVENSRVANVFEDSDSESAALSK